MTSNTIIKNAIEATKSTLGTYFESTCKQRLAGGAGSCYPDYKSVEEMEQALLDADWTPATHPDVMEGCQAYTADIPGLYGLVDVDSLADDAQVVAIDPKGTGCVSLGVKGTRGELVGKTWLIVGPENGVDVVYTFHPGEPVRPSTVKVDDVPDGTVLTKAQAKSLGFKLVKIVG